MDNNNKKGVDITMQAIENSGKVLSPEQQAVLDVEVANLEIAKIRNEISKLNIDSAENNLFAATVNELRIDIQRSAFPLNDEFYNDFVLARLLAPVAPDKDEKPVDLDITPESPTENTELPPEQNETPINLDITAEQPETPPENSTGSSGQTPIA